MLSSWRVISVILALLMTALVPAAVVVLRLQNTTYTDANDLIIRVYDRDGKRLDRSIPANQSRGLNFKVLSGLGTDFTGTVT